MTFFIECCYIYSSPAIFYKSFGITAPVSNVIIYAHSIKNSFFYLAKIFAGILEYVDIIGIIFFRYYIFFKTSHWNFETKIHKMELISQPSVSQEHLQPKTL